MIRVAIDLCPLGDERDDVVERLGTLIIANDGRRSSEDPRRGTYHARMYDRTGHIIRRAYVEDWPRKSKPVQALVTRCLEEMGY